MWLVREEIIKLLQTSSQEKFCVKDYRLSLGRPNVEIFTIK